ncbi:hypothetical protein [Anaerohalosphaera lusitana]|uniref:hypothetical protein n=1 Tax=Anaerohalosphaera lusitana TaxID=1936003 RepID=UPI001F339AE9|nr:hypothetical protein [Anaerohalosphaera lusitana]
MSEDESAGVVPVAGSMRSQGQSYSICQSRGVSAGFVRVIVCVWMSESPAAARIWRSVFERSNADAVAVNTAVSRSVDAMRYFILPFLVNRRFRFNWP